MEKVSIGYRLLFFCVVLVYCRVRAVVKGRVSVITWKFEMGKYSGLLQSGVAACAVHLTVHACV